MDFTRHENSEMSEDLTAVELIQYTQEKLPHYSWLFARSATKRDPGTTHGEG
jgi:hypothetical protein